MTESPRERKVSSTGCSIGRSLNSRASLACCGCRSRKVRCDVVSRGSPCTNCRFGNVDCLVAKGRRRRRKWYPGVNDVWRPDSLSGCTSELSQLPTNTHNSPEIASGLHFPGIHCDPSHGNPEWPVNITGTQAASDGCIFKDIHFTQSHQRVSKLGSSETKTWQNSLVPNLDSGKSFYHCDSLPIYIRGLPATLNKVDVEYLASKGVLLTPEVTLRNALLRAYVHYVHPYMPILDIEDFLHRIIESGSSHRISLLLFQSVMFAGSAFIDLELLQTAGYKTKKDARRKFFHRARLLYSFDYETDQITLVQSLLLMTYYDEKPGHHKDSWHWMDVILSLAHTIGLNCDPRTLGLDLGDQRMRKRIWWSIYVRDRLLALGTRRPICVKDEDSSVPLLTPNDFQINSCSPNFIRLLDGSDILENAGFQRELALMFIEKSKLCVVLGQVLSTQYFTIRYESGKPTETMMLSPKSSMAGKDEMRYLNQLLETWLNDLPTETQFRPMGQVKLSDAQQVLHLHRALLRLIYHTTCSALHRPQLDSITPSASLGSETQEVSLFKVLQATMETTTIALEMEDLGLTSYYPPIGVTILMPAAIVSMLETRSDIHSIRTASLQRLCQCIRILNSLREVYAAADFAFTILEAAIQKLGLLVTATEEDAHSPFLCDQSNDEVLQEGLPCGDILTPQSNPHGLQFLAANHVQGAPFSGWTTEDFFVRSPHLFDSKSSGLVSLDTGDNNMSYDYVVIGESSVKQSFSYSADIPTVCPTALHESDDLINSNEVLEFDTAGEITCERSQANGARSF